MKKNILGSFREKAGVTRKTAISAISAVLAVALIATVAFGFIPDTAIKASAESIGLISSASGKNYLPDTYTAVNVPAGTYTMTEADYAKNTPQPSDNGVAAFDFHIFAKNFASKAHTCGNIAVENLGAPTAGATGAPEFGSRPNHDTTSIKLSYVENISDWSTSAQADAFVFDPNNTVTEKSGQVFVETPSGKYMMGNGKALMDKTYIDDATPFIDIDAELTEAENYQRYLVWLMEDIREKAKDYYTPGWGYATQAENGETVRVLTHPDVAGWGWMGTTIDFSKYPEDTIIVDLDLYEGQNWWTGQKEVGSNAQNLINGSVTLKGTAGKRIIFNVESSSGFNADNIKFADTNMKADKMGNSEDSVKLDNNILWNFYNRDSGVPKSTSGTITVGGTWMGSILAPNATVKCSAGLNGSIIAKNVTTSAETHKSDYTGEKVTKSDETSIKVTKIWQNDDPNTRPAEITVRLLQNGKAIKTVQLSTANKTADGTWEYTFDKLPVTDGRGTSYRYDIEEVVPKGYTCNIVNNTIINTGKGEKPKLGSLTFNKRPEGDPAKFLKDAEFKLTIDTGASLAGVTATGVSNFKATDGAVTWTSTDSAAVFSNLPYGNYTITETKAPAGYVTSNPVTVKVDGPVAAMADMTDKQIAIKLAKLEGKNNEFLPGATMELTPNWGTSLANVKVEGVTTTSHDANKITWTSGKNAVTIKGIPAGSYTLTETNAPMGYDKAAPMTFIVEADGTVKVNSAAVNRVDMINNLTPAVIKTYTINIGKKDGAGSSVDGAVLKLTSVNGSDLSKVTVDGQTPSLSDKNKSITWTSGSDPAVFANLPAGSYTLTEVTAPAGYKLAGQMSITVSADGQSFDMIDEAIEMTISKQDSETYKELAGATLKLESTSNKN
ncbi:MAG: Cna B-type domain-containing protein, partial [Clostridia bacterium]|nr:Cna B-type domain-containing protein [Clostridia bacterium]